MKHFEINISINNTPFNFKCTTAAEAYDALKDIHNFLHWQTYEPFDLDAYMEKLVEMKAGKLLQVSNAIFSIIYAEGEV